MGHSVYFSILVLQKKGFGFNKSKPVVTFHNIRNFKKNAGFLYYVSAQIMMQAKLNGK
jgi:hypothetical protein